MWRCFGYGKQLYNKVHPLNINFKASAGHGSPVGVVDLTGLGEGHVAHVLVSEMQVSFLLAFATCMVAGNKKWDLQTATFMIGMTVFVGTLSGFMAGAGVMNPARALGPAILAREYFDRLYIR